MRLLIETFEIERRPFMGEIEQGPCLRGQRLTSPTPIYTLDFGLISSPVLKIIRKRTFHDPQC